MDATEYIEKLRLLYDEREQYANSHLMDDFTEAITIFDTLFEQVLDNCDKETKEKVEAFLQVVEKCIDFEDRYHQLAQALLP